MRRRDSRQDGEPDWDTPGGYTVKVTDTGGANGLQPATGTIRVVAPSVTVMAPAPFPVTAAV